MLLVLSFDTGVQVPSPPPKFVRKPAIHAGFMICKAGISLFFYMDLKKAKKRRDYPPIASTNFLVPTILMALFKL
jgi:hypothetical protein